MDGFQPGFQPGFEGVGVAPVVVSTVNSGGFLDSRARMYPVEYSGEFVSAQWVKQSRTRKKRLAAQRQIEDEELLMLLEAA